jgi:hypothetical protein
MCCICAQVVLSSQLCDVTAAAALKDAASSCRVLYNSAAYLSTIAHRLNIPVEVQQGLQYCYPLPAAAGAAPQQHCQVSSKRGVRCSAAVITVCVWCCVEDRPCCQRVGSCAALRVIERCSEGPQGMPAAPVHYLLSPVLVAALYKHPRVAGEMVAVCPHSRCCCCCCCCCRATCLRWHTKAL